MHAIPGKVVKLAHLRKLRQCEQVAAVCYRSGSEGMEFLLVRTRGGRWTFPKGGVEPGLTHAQAAALEAFEEAGVHGRMEEAAFARYFAGGSAIHAHLCQVKRLSPPQETGRDRTWFSAAEAKQRLRESRVQREAAEFARVIDQSVLRIQQRQRTRGPQLLAREEDPLRRVRFEHHSTVQTTLAQRHGSGTFEGIPAPGLRRAKILRLNAPR